MERGTRAVRRQAGQGMTEYVIVVALVAVAAIAIVQVFGQQLRSTFYTMARALAGHQESTENKTGGAGVERNQKSLADFAAKP